MFCVFAVSLSTSMNQAGANWLYQFRFAINADVEYIAAKDSTTAYFAKIT